MAEPNEEETMEVIETGINDLLEIRPRLFKDERGWFMESYNEQRFLEALGKKEPFVQDNISCSGKHSLRGLHFQAPPHAQSKLVMVTQGRALDVVVDIRKGSSTYGQHYKVVLDADLMNQLYVPRGFAHGFLSLEEHTVFQYKCDNQYHQSSERTLLWNDPDLDIDWEVISPLVSTKDQAGLAYKEFQSPFIYEH